MIKKYVNKLIQKKLEHHFPLHEEFRFEIETLQLSINCQLKYIGELKRDIQILKEEISLLKKVIGSLNYINNAPRKGFSIQKEVSEIKKSFPTERLANFRKNAKPADRKEKIVESLLKVKNLKNSKELREASKILNLSPITISHYVAFKKQGKKIPYDRKMSPDHVKIADQVMKENPGLTQNKIFELIKKTWISKDLHAIHVNSLHRKGSGDDACKKKVIKLFKEYLGK